MKIQFTNLYKANAYGAKNIHNNISKGINNLIKKNIFIGGSIVSDFEKSFAKFTGSNFCIGVANGTDALEIALEALDLKKGSEVIVPVNTWISTAEAVTRSGLKIIFCDISLNDYTICLKDLKKKINNRTTAIMVVHLYGYPANIKKIKQIIGNKKIKIVEDCAQAHGSKIRKKHVGNFGEIGTFSFFPGKNVGAYGDAGGIITNDRELALKCRLIKNHGAIDKYSHQLEGRNSRLDSMQALILKEKLKFYNKKLFKRIYLARIYLRTLADEKNIILPILNFKNHQNSFHQFVIRLEKRDELREFLKKNGISTMIHYPYMLNELKFYKNNSGNKSLKNSIKLGKKILSLPISEEHTEKEITYVCHMIKKFFNLQSSKH